jgi:hypothetical protein
MNIRKLAVAAIIALSATTAAFAQNSSYINPQSLDPATIEAWVQLEVGSSVDVSVKCDLSSMSYGEQIQASSGTASYQIVSVDGTPGLSATLNDSELVSGGKMKFDFTVTYDQGVNYGAHAVKITLENSVTHQLMSVMLLVTVI